MNKLTVVSILPEVSEITGLDNYNLTGKSTLDRKTGKLIIKFLAQLPGSLCLDIFKKREWRA